MIDLQDYYENMGCHPPIDDTSPDSTNFSQDLLSKEKWGPMTGVEEAANMV
jgi:hypothetical protein